VVQGAAGQGGMRSAPDYRPDGRGLSNGFCKRPDSTR
jgi:hypothetical protein